MGWTEAKREVKHLNRLDERREVMGTARSVDHDGIILQQRRQDVGFVLDEPAVVLDLAVL